MRVNGAKFGLILTMLLLTNLLNAQTLTITAAADLRYAMDEVVKAYKQTHPKTEIKVNYGSSGTAFQQISNGAPFDIFFSADIMYPQKLKEQGLTATDPKLYAIGYIVVWSNQIDVSKGINSLLDTKVSKIAIANPDHAPYGKRAEESMKYYNIYNKVKNKLVFGENISQAAQFVQTGNAEIGILALSLACSPVMKDKGKYTVIDDKSHSPLEQAYVILKGAKNNKEAYSFVEFVASFAARTIFKTYGFKLPYEK
ncbi:MAG: molybdate ABC transporter substrate-binding protein [Bacteroidota bacterium]|nr:molybdate ABC transporter substrate-binding protein [Bacteroidota bacterium]